MTFSKHITLPVLFLSCLLIALCAGAGDNNVFQLVKPDPTHTNLEIVAEGLERLNSISQKVKKILTQYKNI